MKMKNFLEQNINLTTHRNIAKEEQVAPRYHHTIVFQFIGLYRIWGGGDGDGDCDV